MPDRVILHVDMNCYYASVEMLQKPSLRAVPMAVAGDPVNRHGIILAKNELAKKTGIKTGEAIWEAMQKCPGLVVMPPNYTLYIHYAHLARQLYGQYTDRVEPFGLDESWVELTDCPRQDGPLVADELRQRIRRELGLTASVGVSWNKIYAKLGSDLKKPDATTVISRDNYRQRVFSAPAGDLLYVGPSSIRKLRRIGIRTIGQIVEAGPVLMRQMFGIVGLSIYAFAAGLDETPVAMSGREAPIKSIGNSLTTFHDLYTENDIKATAYMLTESVASRLRDAGLAARTVQVSLRDYNLFNFERQAPLPHPTQLCGEIAPAAIRLILENFQEGRWIRSLGVRACNLVGLSQLRQQSFLPDDARLARRLDLERTIDSLRDKYGGLAVRRGISLVDRALTDHYIKGENVVHPVGFFGP